MFDPSTVKHTFHVLILCSLIIIFQLALNPTPANTDQTKQPHGAAPKFLIDIIFYLQYILFLTLPQTTFNLLGLIFFNPFRKKEDQKVFKIQSKFVDLPHFCFRVVTRGLFPDLVRSNVNKNYTTCINAGLSNFSFEVVTDNNLSLPKKDRNIRELVVPTSYKTSTGALFKARALQYALEPRNSFLSPGDYIIHLDEETIITENVINGIMNFVLEGRHAFGQGLITYSNQGVVNWITTLADSIRISEDMGKLRFQFQVFQKPLFGWKGSFVVSKYEAECNVTFDHGPGGSIAEDCYFSMIAFKKGYTFGFIEGEMWERSPFSILDFIRQRKRWAQGIMHVVHSPEIPMMNKFFLTMSLYGWLLFPFTTIGCIGGAIISVPTPATLCPFKSYTYAVTLYLYIFGVLKSHDVGDYGLNMLFVQLIGVIITMPFNMIMENIAILWAILSRKYNFYIVDKNIGQEILDKV